MNDREERDESRLRMIRVVEPEELQRIRGGVTSSSTSMNPKLERTSKETE